LPGANDEEFHEEGTREMLLALNYHFEDTRSKIPMHANVLPTCLTEGTTEERWKAVSSTLQLQSYRAHDCSCSLPLEATN